MQRTDEQKAVIAHRGNARVNAVAGSGKTSTLVGYAQERPSQRILYLAYNRSVREEAVRKFWSANCHNVKIETAHSLAYRMLDVRRNYQITQSGNLRLTDIIELCGLQPAPQSPNFHLIFARHIQRLLTGFCNSAARSFAELDYLAGVTDSKAREFVQANLGEIYSQARAVLARMYKAEIPITHDAYLKFFQLTDPLLQFDAILFDEGQDASPVMLDVFLRQRATKVIVGDTHQQIYRFRGAVNSLENVPFTDFTLSTSFRFRQEVADLAERALSLKSWIRRYPNPVRITGAGDCQEKNSRAVIARSNLRLLKAAIDAMIYRGFKRLHFEGDLNSYTYLNEGASLFDVLHLRLGNRAKIRNPFIKAFEDYPALLEYMEAAEDTELRLIVEIVNEYGPALFDYIRRLRELQVPKEAAEIIFSTVHKAKGQEYDQVEVAEDFINGEKLEVILAKARKDPEKFKNLDLDALAEEINILYVAITRVKNVLMIPFDVLHGNNGDSDYYVLDGRGEKQDRAAGE